MQRSLLVGIVLVLGLALMLPAGPARAQEGRRLAHLCQTAEGRALASRVLSELTGFPVRIETSGECVSAAHTIFNTPASSRIVNIICRSNYADFGFPNLGQCIAAGPPVPGP